MCSKYELFYNAICTTAFIKPGTDERGDQDMIEFNSDTRKQIKRAARDNMKGRLASITGVQILNALPFIVLAIIFYVVFFVRLFVYAFRGVFIVGPETPSVDPSIVFSLIGEITIMTIVYALALLLIGAPLTFGLMRYFIRLGRGERPTVGVLGSGFLSYFASIKLNICLGFRSFLWLFFPVIIYAFAGTYIDMNTFGAGYIFLNMLKEIIYLIVVFLIGIKLQEYAGAYVLMGDDKTRGAWESTKESSRHFKGHYMDLLVFNLSFIPWALLIFLLASISIGAVVSMAAFSVSGSAIMIIVIAAIIIIFLLSCYVTCYQRTAFFMLCDYLGMYPETGSDETAEGREEADETAAPQIAAAETASESENAAETASAETSEAAATTASEAATENAAAETSEAPEEKSAEGDSANS